MEKWLNDIHNRLKDYEQDSPAGLWEDLQVQMKQKGTAEKGRQKHPMIPLWPKRIAMAASIVATLLLGYRYAPHFTHETALVSSSNETNSVKPMILSENSPRLYSPSSKSEAIVAERTREAPLAINMTNRKRSASTFTQRNEEIKQEASSATADRPENSNSLPEAHTVTPTPSAKQSTQTNKQKASLLLLTSQRENGKSKMSAIKRNTGRQVTFSTYAAGLTGTETSSKSMSAYPASSLGPDNSNWNDSPMLGIAVFNQGKTTEKKVQHRLPVRVGASFSYDLNDYLAIGSGLTYTRLHSTLREGTGKNYQRSEQNLHYMGIPVNLKYTFFRRKNLSLYAQGGALAELRVAGKKEKEYILDGKNIGADTERITSHPLQMSANLAAGIQYNLTSTMAIYAEPGVSHYFKDKSSVPTIYQEKPTNFNLNLGVRICL
ncbi:MAG: porin family protein, partial [Bacteroidaceae bacterium]